MQPERSNLAQDDMYCNAWCKGSGSGRLFFTIRIIKSNHQQLCGAVRAVKKKKDCLVSVGGPFEYKIHLHLILRESAWSQQVISTVSEGTAIITN